MEVGIMNNQTKGYWTRKEEMAHKAYEHYIYMGRTFPKEINNSILNTKVFTELAEPIEKVKSQTTTIDVVDMDSVSAIFNYRDYNEKIAVLNFASYKNPGGMFLKGSTAQEESLCHASTLYNVLSQFPEYYNYNKKNLNNALYTNRALYSPNIIFGKDNLTTCCDVITCAAPNWTTANRYNRVSANDNTHALVERIRFILQIASIQEVDTLILGAFGCGVFGQNPFEVANIFMHYLTTTFAGDFKRIVFAIPSSKTNKNLQAFRTLFGCSKVIHNDIL